MLRKNKEKQERAAKRKPPIPYTRKTPTKIEKIRKLQKRERIEVQEDAGSKKFSETGTD